jgi:hypothetical protein
MIRMMCDVFVVMFTCPLSLACYASFEITRANDASIGNLPIMIPRWTYRKEGSVSRLWLEVKCIHKLA